MTPPQRRLALEASFERLAATVPATIGMAIAGPGRAETRSFGRWRNGVAWSTIKVPLAIAALRRDRPRTQELAVKAITESDNAASEKLWSLLGAPAEAAQRLQAVIEESGNTATVVESQRIRPGFTAFGQTQWALVDQAHFASYLPAIPDAAGVVDLMHRLVPEHRWGLAAKGVAAKGGWGPGADDGYLVRQFGFVPMQFGDLGVALAAEASAFETGVGLLNEMAEWLFGHLPDLTRQR